MANETPDIVPELAELRKPYVLPMPDPFRTQTSAAVTGETMPKIDKKALGQTGTRGEMTNIRQQQADLLQQEAESKRYISGQEQQIAEYKAKGQADIAKQESEQARQIAQSVETFREKNPAPELAPTKDNIQSLSTLFGLIGVIGMAMGGAGKQSATASLNAMGGMMKGWQQGRADLWKREVQEFDKNMLTWKSKLDDAMKKAEAAYKVLPYNRAEAESRLNEVIVTLGSGVLKEKNRLQGFEPAYKMLENLHKDSEFVMKESGTERRHKETITAQKELQEARDKSAKELEEMREKAAEERATDAARQKLMDDVRKRQLGPIDKKSTEAKALKPPAKIIEGYIANTQLKTDVEDIAKDLKNPKLQEQIKKYRAEAFLTEEGKILNQMITGDIPTELREFLTKIRDVRNNYYLNISGKAVTGGEALRNYGVVPQPGDEPEVMMDKLRGMSKRIGDQVSKTQQLFKLPDIQLSPGAPTSLRENEDYSLRGAGTLEFSSVEEVNAAKLPSGTRVKINGRLAEVE
jgi:hypothetical protein